METGNQLLGRMVTINGVQVKIVGVWAAGGSGGVPAEIMFMIVTEAGKFGLHNASDPNLTMLDPMEKPRAGVTL